MLRVLRCYEISGKWDLFLCAFIKNIYCIPTLLCSSDTWVSKTEKALHINQWIILLSIWVNTFSNAWIWEAVFITLSVLKIQNWLWHLNFWMSFSSVWDWLGCRWLWSDWWMALSNFLSLNPHIENQVSKRMKKGRNAEKNYGNLSTHRKRSRGKGLATWNWRSFWSTMWPLSTEYSLLVFLIRPP